MKRDISIHLYSHDHRFVNRDRLRSTFEIVDKIFVGSNEESVIECWLSLVILRDYSETNCIAMSQE